MNLATAKNLTDGHLGGPVVILLKNGDVIAGTLKGVNTRGVRIVPDGATKETTRGLTRIDNIQFLDEPADDIEEIEDTRTEADYESEVAAFFTADRIASEMDVLNADVELEDENPEGGDMDDTAELPEDEADEDVTRNEDEYDFEGEMTVITMDGGAYIESDDIPDDVSEITDEGPALPGSVSTPRELAEVFGASAFAIRQALRALGLNVGKGKRYDLSSLTTKELTSIREKVASK